MNYRKEIIWDREKWLSWSNFTRTHKKKFEVNYKNLEEITGNCEIKHTVYSPGSYSYREESFRNKLVIQPKAKIWLLIICIKESVFF